MPANLLIFLLNLLSLRGSGPLIKIISSDELPTTPDRFFALDNEKCYITNGECPNKNITFHLYTRDTQTKPHELSVANPETIKQAKFAKARPLIVLIHGYTGHKDFSPNTEIRPAYFQQDEYNIISVDYHPLAPEPCYYQSVQNLPTVGKCTAQLIDYLIQNNFFKLDDIHVIGFSLGAQTAGMVGKNMKSGKLKRITGLDPAKPLFVFADGSRRLEKDDGEFVDVVHTDVMQRGRLAAVGHVDFYANGGLDQPGCVEQKDISKGSCNHARAPEYYAESINSKIGFWGYKCNGWLQWVVGFCRESDEVALMGEYVSKEARGTYFFSTNSKPPYAQGRAKSNVTAFSDE